MRTWPGGLPPLEDAGCPWSPTDRNRTATLERETLLDSLDAPRSLLRVRQAPPLERFHGLGVRVAGTNACSHTGRALGAGRLKGAGRRTGSWGALNESVSPRCAPGRWPSHSTPAGCQGYFPTNGPFGCRVLRCRCRFCMEKRASL